MESLYVPAHPSGTAPLIHFRRKWTSKAGEGFILEVQLGLYRTNRSACRRFYLFNLKKMNFFFIFKRSQGAKCPFSVRYLYPRYASSKRLHADWKLDLQSLHAG
uniref:Uncharacterized protein n=1 Tax=Morchella brunnea TaxID=1174671 RepID=A0A8K1I7M2_9PEZI|nr:hypothetical protein LK370_mgp219 [Morchella brunnea]UBU98361.1 hypothetical protein [Morchella brunnea]